MKTLLALSALTLLSAGATIHAADNRTVVVTMSNTAENQLLVYDTEGTLLESVPTLGQGGVGQNGGGVAAFNGTVAVVNFGSQSVTVLSRGTRGVERREFVPTLSPPVRSRAAATRT